MAAYLRRAGRAASLAALTLALLWGGTALMRRETVWAPLARSLHLPGVRSARYLPPPAGVGGPGTLELTLANGVDLAQVAQAAEARASALLGAAPRLVVAGSGQDRLAPLAERLDLAVAEAMATGRYLEMGRQVAALARRAGAQAQLTVLPGGVGLSVRRGNLEYYQVIPWGAVPGPAAGGTARG